MKPQSQIFTLFIFLFAFFSGSIFAESAFENINSSSNNSVAELSETTSEDDSLIKNEWFIYYKTNKKVIAGPFNTVEETMNAWLDNKKIKPKAKYFIGRNGRLFTDNPESYYRRKYENVLNERNMAAAYDKAAAEKAAEEEKAVFEKEAAEKKLAEEAAARELSEKEQDIISEQPIEVSENQESAPLSRREQRAKEKAEKKAEKKRIEAEKKAAKEKEKNPEIFEPLELQNQNSEKKTDEAVSITKKESNADMSSIDIFGNQKETENESQKWFFGNNTEEASIELPPEVFTGNRYQSQKSYLSDFIARDVFGIPEEQESDLEKEFQDFDDEPDSKGVTSLMKAVREGNDWKIRTLIKAGSDVNAKDNDGWTPLMYAVRYQSNLAVVDILLSEKADVKASNNYALSALVLASCFNDNPDIIRKLLSYYSPSDKEVQKAFVQLISTQQSDNFALISKVKLFLDFGLPVNSYYDGKTPLMYACKNCTSTKVIKLLLDKNTAVTVRSTEGKTAFDYAQENKALPRDEVFWSLNRR